MKNFFLIITLFTFFTSCQGQKDNSEPTKKMSFNNLFYKTLKCKIQEYVTSVYIYSPHIIGVWVNENSSKIEYFRTLGFKENENALYYESIVQGESNYQTTLSIKSKETKRIKIAIKDQEIKLVAIKKLDENNRPIEPLLYNCEVGENILTKKTNLQ